MGRAHHYALHHGLAAHQGFLSALQSGQQLQSSKKTQKLTPVSHSITRLDDFEPKKALTKSRCPSRLAGRKQEPVAMAANGCQTVFYAITVHSAMFFSPRVPAFPMSAIPAIPAIPH